MRQGPGKLYTFKTLALRICLYGLFPEEVGGGQELTTKGNKETTWGDGNVPYFIMVVVILLYTFVQIHQIIHKIIPVLMRILLYINVFQ